MRQAPQTGARCRQFQNCRSSGTGQGLNLRYALHRRLRSSTSSQGGGLIVVHLSMVHSAIREEIAMPQFKYQTSPNARGVIASARKVLVQQSADSPRVEVTTLKRRRIQQDRRHPVLQFVPHPVPQRQRKSLLGPIENLLGYAHSSRQPGKNVLLPAPPHLPISRQTRDPLKKKMIKNRNSHFKRREHAHSIYLGKNVSRKICLGVEIQDATQPIVRRRSLEISAVGAHGISMPQSRCPELIRKNCHFPVEGV